jgi:sugar phosphate isomerase/epimerase
LRISPDGSLHLTYCTNIHAADGWPAVFAALKQYAPALKARFSPNAPFGVGLRLSARDARELIDNGVGPLRKFLEDNGLYVAIINGFPHGSFHRSVVKADVYAPDWRDPERVRYTTDLIDILSVLVPDDVDGGVSTVPLSYKAWIGDGSKDDWRQILTNVVDVAATLVRLRDSRGVLIHLDIEPEPDCAIETTDETLSFFRGRLFVQGAAQLAAVLDVDADEARRLLADHIRVCFDCCHFSVEHEDPRNALKTISEAGIGIGRIQLSSALRVNMPAGPVERLGMVERLRPFADSTYLHQVIRRDGRAVEHFADLDMALAQPKAGDWRIHFHVPLFTAEYDGLGSTQDDVRNVIEAAATTGVTHHLEIETYTWDVLPARLKIDLIESIAREYDWVLGCLRTRPSS